MSSWSYPLLSAAAINLVEGDILLLRDAARAIDTKSSIRIAGYGGALISQGVLAAYAARPSASQESKKIAASVIMASDIFTVARIGFEMFKGYDTSNDVMYGPVGALVCAIEAATMGMVLKGKL